jgi:hypothetical protein
MLVVTMNDLKPYFSILNERFDAYWNRNGYTFKKDEFNIKELQNYYLVTLGSSAHSFIAKMDFANKALGPVKAGDIFKPASYKVPAKNVRGNIFDSDHGARALDDYRIRYM